MKMGAAIYADECSACHAQKGTGIPGLFPALKGSPSLQSGQPTSAIHVILRGARSVATDGAPTAPAMPSFSWVLNDGEVVAGTWHRWYPQAKLAASARRCSSEAISVRRSGWQDDPWHRCRV
jgi:mono/diheme cytochrome c family protein